MSRAVGIDLGTTNSVVSVLEGGYNLHGLASASHAHVEALIGRAIPVRETRPANY